MSPVTHICHMELMEYDVFVVSVAAVRTASGPVQPSILCTATAVGCGLSGGEGTSPVGSNASGCGVDCPDSVIHSTGSAV